MPVRCRPSLAIVLVLLMVALLVASPPRRAEAVNHDTYRSVRGRYEGLTLRLRIDLDQVTGAHVPNVVSLDGIGHGRENAPVLFGRMERVFLQRVTNEGGTRLDLTIYRTQQEADRFRASAIPQPSYANPNYGRTLAAFAQLGSTNVTLELKAGKKDPEGQEREIETLLDRVFYLNAEPTREEMEQFVRQRRGLSIQRLRELTDLDAATLRAILDEAPADAAPPQGSGPPAPHR